MLTSDKWIVQLIADQCELHGMKHIVFSPGSRNAPLAITFDALPNIQKHIIHDERVAAFFALGLAQSTGEMVGLCCTSGSAALNYYPAIAEAFYRSLPIVVITADRPNAWVNQGDGQTIVQKNVFQNHIQYEVQLDEQTETKEFLWYAQRETALAFQKSTQGPIHINIGLKEPLYQTANKNQSFGRKISIGNNSPMLSAEFKEEFESTLGAKKIMVLCGQMTPNRSLEIALSQFAVNSNVVVLVENTSNLHDERFISCIDRTLNGIDHNEKEKFKPEILITLGGAVVSKRIKTFLRETKLTAHWKIGFDFQEMDTYQQLTHSIVMSPSTFFASLNDWQFERNKLNFFGIWKKLDYLAKDKLPYFFQEQKSLTDLTVFFALFQLLPDHSVLHMANSSVVRYCQLFDAVKNVRYESNRGTSGIDGSGSTALGSAHGLSEKSHLFVTGDISALYDSNVFWINRVPKNFKMIVVHNGGGGIFKIIPGPATSPQREKYFEAIQCQLVGKVAESFGWKSCTITKVENLFESLEDFINPENPYQILEIITDSEGSPKHLDDFFEYLRTQ
jgi:2-succinyl-5-enolpyruvyl-6-hydroxy-3-cyclohexene-1-carboxylate synthase